MLADAVLEAEAERQAATADREKLTLQEGLAQGGAFTFYMLLVINIVENFEGATLGVLAPDIRDSLGISDGAIVFI
ncbi:MAG: ABC transporter, partial [Acidimicrobiales bacterium]